MADMGTPAIITGSAQAALDASTALAVSCRQRVRSAANAVAAAKSTLEYATGDYAKAKLQLIAADAMVEAAKAVVDPKATHGLWYVAGAVAVVVILGAAALYFLL